MGYMNYRDYIHLMNNHYFMPDSIYGYNMDDLIIASKKKHKTQKRRRHPEQTRGKRVRRGGFIRNPRMRRRHHPVNRIDMEETEFDNHADSLRAKPKGVRPKKLNPKNKKHKQNKKKPKWPYSGAILKAHQAYLNDIGEENPNYYAESVPATTYIPNYLQGTGEENPNYAESVPATTYITDGEYPDYQTTVAEPTLSPTYAPEFAQEISFPEEEQVEECSCATPPLEDNDETVEEAESSDEESMDVGPEVSGKLGLYGSPDMYGNIRVSAYEVLGLDSEASASEISSSFRHLMKKYQSDRTLNNSNSALITSALQSAYAKLISYYT